MAKASRELNVNQLLRDSDGYWDVTITGMREFRVRMVIAKILFYLAFLTLGMPEIEFEITDEPKREQEQDEE